jgi:hypothetical protein
VDKAYRPELRLGRGVYLDHIPSWEGGGKGYRSVSFGIKNMKRKRREQKKMGKIKNEIMTIRRKLKLNRYSRIYAKGTKKSQKRCLRSKF